MRDILTSISNPGNVSPSSDGSLNTSTSGTPPSNSNSIFSKARARALSATAVKSVLLARQSYLSSNSSNSTTSNSASSSHHHLFPGGLPYDLIRQILSYHTGDMKTLRSCGRVCKVWFEVAFVKIWSTLSINRRMGVNLLRPHPQQLQLQMFGDMNTQMIIKRYNSLARDGYKILPALNKLIAAVWKVVFYEMNHGDGSSSSKSGVAKLLDGLPSGLGLSKVRPWFSKFSPFLKEVYLHSPYDIDKVLYLIRGFKENGIHLDVLSWDTVNPKTTYFFPAFLEACPPVKRLRIDGGQWWGYSLGTLEIEDEILMDVDCLGTVGTPSESELVWGSLEELELVNCGLTRVTLRRILRACRSLKKLTLEGLSDMEPEILRDDSSLNPQQQAEMIRQSDLRAEEDRRGWVDALCISSNFYPPPRLEYLTIQRCDADPGIGYSVVRDFGIAAISLIQLNVFNNTWLNEDEGAELKEELKREFPRLEVVLVDSKRLERSNSHLLRGIGPGSGNGSRSGSGFGPGGGFDLDHIIRVSGIQHGENNSIRDASGDALGNSYGGGGSVRSGISSHSPSISSPLDGSSSRHGGGGGHGPGTGRYEGKVKN